MAGLAIGIITKNETLYIHERRKSEEWTDEFIVADIGRAEDTVGICP